MGNRTKVYVLLAGIALLCAGAFTIRALLQPAAAGEDSQKDGGSGDEEDSAVPVAVEVAVRGPISNALTSTANLRARREVEVATRAAGIVTDLHVEEGDAVAAGQILCSLDDRELRINLELAEQRLAQTKIQLEAAAIRREQTENQIRNKRTELNRNESALAEGLLAESEVALERHQIEDLEHELRVVESTVRENSHRIDELESEISRAQLLISQTEITAPFAGRITERSVELGQSVRVAEKLFKLGAFTPLYVDIFLADQDSLDAKPGQPVTIRLGLGEGAVASGEVERVSPVVDEATGTVKVTAKFQPPSAAFRPGAFVRVEIETDTHHDAVLIPKRAVFEEDGASYVVLVGADSTARRAQVELGYQNGTAVEALSGVQEGATVVVAGQGKLKDGDKTRVVAN